MTLATLGMIVSLVLLIPMAGTAAYLLFFALVGHVPARKRRSHPSQGARQANMALLVPAYKEDAVILESANNLLRQHYPAHAWDLVVIADSMQPETLAQLQAMPLKLIEVSFEKSTKAKALNRALEQLDGSAYDLAVVLDADNHAPDNFLAALNDRYQAGDQIIQVRRVAKSRQSPIAVLDAISEEVNNHIFCLAHRRLGLSSRLIGSGMAFQYDLFVGLMQANQAVGGFDKELELSLMDAGHEVAYIHHETQVWDEKVSQAQTMKRQRLRWISAQYHYLRRYFGRAWGQLLRHGNLNLFDKTFQLLLMPRLVLIGTTTILALISLVAGWLPYGNFWAITWLAIVVAYLISMPRYLFSKELFRAILWLPVAFFNMIWALRKIGGANKSFIHTPHGVTPQQPEG